MGNEKTRRATRLIIKRGNEFLVGKIPYSHEYRWSISPYDAWTTKEVGIAELIARQLGGDLWLFNPPTGQLREYRKENYHGQGVQEQEEAARPEGSHQ